MGKLLGPTALQRHAGFFDADGDGLVSFAETRARLGDLGLSAPLALFFSVIVNVFLGYLTQGRPSLAIRVATIHRGKHPFDTGIFDDTGSFDASAFEALFQSHSTREPRDRLSENELRAVMLRRGDPHHPFGAIGGQLSKLFSFLEVHVLLCLASDCTKYEGSGDVRAISRRNLRRFVAGRLFYLLARRRRIQVALDRA